MMNNDMGFCQKYFLYFFSRIEIIGAMMFMSSCFFKPMIWVFADFAETRAASSFDLRYDQAIYQF